MKICFLDFEFNRTQEANLNLVCCALTCLDGPDMKYKRDFWLYGGYSHQAAISFFRQIMAEGYVFAAYVMEAEARSLMSLFSKALLPPFKAIDLYLEYRCLLNHNHEYAYGEQYIKGKVITTTPPPNKWYLDSATEEDQEAHHKPEYSLAAATFKLLGVKIDTDEKTRLRDIIIRNDKDEIQRHQTEIQAYCRSDIENLPRLLSRIFRAMGGDIKELLTAAYKRGEYAVRTARMVQLGYPVNFEKVAAFQANVQAILDSSIAAVMESDTTFKPFRQVKGKWVANETKIREWIALQGKPRWRKTEGGKPSLSRDAFKDWYDSESPGFAGAYCRHLKTKQSLNGFMPANGTSKKRFTDFLGSDGRVRPYFGIYGAQSSRSQPAATGFIPLKAHWMRNFIEAPHGKAICGLDYSSQEFLIAAIMSQDEEMMNAYTTGDIYLAFAKEAGLCPKTATKETHKKERDFAKALVLGMSYDMGAVGLSSRLGVSEERAEELIDTFYGLYSSYAVWKKEIQNEYRTFYQLSLSDGWVMWGDNENTRSVGNFPIQGMGAVIMRRAVAIAQDMDLDVIYTLHDAIYIECPSRDLSHVAMLKEAMLQAFREEMSGFGRFEQVRIEGDVWSKDFSGLSSPAPWLNVMKEYVDDKGKADLERFRPFLQKPIQPITGGNHGVQESFRGKKLCEVFGMQAESSPC
jgi:DNA polymerase family A